MLQGIIHKLYVVRTEPYLFIYLFFFHFIYLLIFSMFIVRVKNKNTRLKLLYAQYSFVRKVPVVVNDQTHTHTRTGNECVWVCKHRNYAVRLLMCITIGLSPIPLTRVGMCVSKMTGVCVRRRKGSKTIYNNNNNNNTDQGLDRVCVPIICVISFVRHYKISCRYDPQVNRV